MVGKGTEPLNTSSSHAQRFLSWPFVQFPLLLYTAVYMFQFFRFSCLIAMDPGIHDIIIMEFCKFVTCLGHGYDHLVQVEYPLWIDIIFTFTTRLFCRCICPPMQIFASMILYQVHVWFAPRQDLSSRFKNDTVVPGSAYPVVLGILSCCQLSMHFCHLSGMSLALSLWQSLASACWYSVYDQLMAFHPVSIVTIYRCIHSADWTR